MACTLNLTLALPLIPLHTFNPFYSHPPSPSYTYTTACIYRPYSAHSRRRAESKSSARPTPFSGNTTLPNNLSRAYDLGLDIIVRVTFIYRADDTTDS
jgi:hypothetical protein